MSRVRNWMLTFWNEPKGYEGKVRYLVYQCEIAPNTGKEHYQGYCEFKEKISVRQIKKLFDDNTIHCEPRFGKQEQAIEYCTKIASRKEGCEPVVYGTPARQGERSDIAEIYEDVQNGDTLREILINHRHNAMRMIHAIERTSMILNGFSMLDEYLLLRRNMQDPAYETTNDDLLRYHRLRTALFNRQ